MESRARQVVHSPCRNRVHDRTWAGPVDEEWPRVVLAG